MILKRHLLFSLSKQHRPAHTDLNLKKPFRSVVLADHGPHSIGLFLLIAAQRMGLFQAFFLGLLFNSRVSL